MQIANLTQYSEIFLDSPKLEELSFYTVVSNLKLVHR